MLLAGVPTVAVTGAPRRVLPYLLTSGGVALALAATGLLSAALGALGLAPLLYLLPVTFAAAYWGRGPAFLGVALAVLGHDVLFVEPVGSLTISRADEAVGLVLLLTTTSVVARLADLAREGAARVREAEVTRQSDALKTALLRAVSHNLRTPLSSIKASASSLAQPDVQLTEADRAELLAAIEEEVDHLDRLVANLLQASRLEAGGGAPHKRLEDLGELAATVVRRLRPVLSDHAVTVRIDPALRPVPCDYAQLDLTITNLLENAARHTPAKTPVTLALRQEDHAVVCEVSDAGPGIPTGDRERLFRPFERGGNPGSSGFGLGLAIARGLIEAHGGQLWLADTPGGGATFAFRLPQEARP